MPWFETKISFRCLGAAAFVLLVGLLVAPQSADAACGDYVWLRGRAPMTEHGMTGRADQASADSTAEKSQSPAVPRCHGPFCSKGSIPPAAPAPSTKVSFERWACVEVALDHDAISTTGLLPIVADRPADGFGQSILRPPR